MTWAAGSPKPGVMRACPAHPEHTRENHAAASQHWQSSQPHMRSHMCAYACTHHHAISRRSCGLSTRYPVLTVDGACTRHAQHAAQSSTPAGQRTPARSGSCSQASRKCPPAVRSSAQHRPPTMLRASFAQFTTASPCTRGTAPSPQHAQHAAQGSAPGGASRLGGAHLVQRVSLTKKKS